MNISRSDSETSDVVIDLTWPIHPDMPLWPGDPATELEAKAAIGRDGYLLHQLRVGEHTGTHIGSANHYLAGANSIAQVGLHELVAPALKINCKRACRKNPEYLVDVADINRWEERYGKIPAHHWLLVETGWSRYWQGDRTIDYWKTFPGISAAAVDFLIAGRDIIGLGIDSAGVDGCSGGDLAAGRCLAHHGRLHLENLKGLQLLPNTGSLLFIGALPIVNGSGSPCRVLALCPDRKNARKKDKTKLDK
jgi:kynurenine formamidase